MQNAIALSRNEIDQARLLCEKAAWTIDQHGNKEARDLVAQIKAVAPQMSCNVIDRAIQVHGAAGVSDDTALARMYGWQRAMRIFDGPDEVHMRTIARAELGREKSAFAAAVTARSDGQLSGGVELPRRRRSTGGPSHRASSSASSELSQARRRRPASNCASLRITDVADLRSPREVERHGSGLVPDGVDDPSAAVPRHRRDVDGRGAARARLPAHDDRQARRRVVVEAGRRGT